MTAPAPSRRRGRPPRAPAYSLFTRLWFCAFKVLSGRSTAYAIDQLRDSKLTEVWPRKSRPYELGRRSPSQRFVDAVEAEYPGTAQYFDSPLKALLRGDTVSRDWVEGQLLALPAQIVDLLVFPLPVASLPVAFLRPFDDERAKQLAAVGGLHALEAAILLMKLGELIPSPDLRRLAREAYIRTQPSVGAHPVLSAFAGELFSCIDAAFPRWIYPRPELRLAVGSPDMWRKPVGLRSPEEILDEENSPRTIKFLTRIAIERRVLEARIRAGDLDLKTKALE